MDLYREANRRLWDEWARIHPGSDFYRLEDFKAGWDPLKAFEVEELGDVSGRSLLHLQCHFGRDTLSWARHGARVTGADFSPVAMRAARALAAELGLEATFVECDLYALPSRLPGRFDIVYTSFGVLGWLPDIVGWAAVVDHFLNPGGTFYIAEFHPVANTLDDEAPEPRVRHGYFHRAAPEAFPVRGSYADPEAEVDEEFEYCWNHSLGDVVSALAGRGLVIEFLHEFPFTTDRRLPYLERRSERYWQLPDGKGELPLMYSIRASKPPAG
ncbi:MAG: class I SAM-dependent methyltransferase [Candidatus Dormibacteraeota bacterium]|nr:class I SAM-dependent methyltransferase [Candidatus Dormibacteraeota bacterium]